MAKRLTDTTKWTNKAFRSLSDKHKLFYLYILDNCDNAGVIRVDLDLIGFTLGNTFTREEIESEFEERLVFISEDKIMIRNYIAFQNGDVFKSESRIAGSIRSTLNSHGLLERYRRGEFGTTNEAVALD
jgi:hypothetical protein